MKKFLGMVFIFISNFTFAKTINPNCIGVTSSNFTAGSGAINDPYLICNKVQYQRLGSDLDLRDKSFILGSDLSFKTTLVTRIGRQTSPFTGTFDGNNYTLSFIKLYASSNLSHVGMFGYLKNGKVTNLILNNFAIEGGGLNIGAIAGVAENSIIDNVQVKSITLNAPQRSGGLIGMALNSTIQNSSSHGILNLSTNSSMIGGLIGLANSSSVSSSSSNVKLLETATDISATASSIGGLIGELKLSSVQNTYAIGDIDFSRVINMTTMPKIGGLVGSIDSSSISKSFYAGKIIDVDGSNVGGAIAAAINATWDNVIWDASTSGIYTSALGEVSVTCLMLQAQFWLNRGFNTSIWNLVDGAYPKLIWQV